MCKLVEMLRTAIIIIFPELAPNIDKWRLRTVEVARRGVPPHVTLLFPWKEAPVRDDDIAIISDLCKGVTSFNVEFDELKHFPGGTVYLSLRNEQKILSLSKQIWSRFPETPPYEGIHKNPVPHLTVAQSDVLTISKLYADVLLDIGDSLPFSCEVSGVAILEEDVTGEWHIRTRIALD